MDCESGKQATASRHKDKERHRKVTHTAYEHPPQSRMKREPASGTDTNTHTTKVGLYDNIIHHSHRVARHLQLCHQLLAFRTIRGTMLDDMVQNATKGEPASQHNKDKRHSSSVCARACV